MLHVLQTRRNDNDRKFANDWARVELVEEVV